MKAYRNLLLLGLEEEYFQCYQVCSGKMKCIQKKSRMIKVQEMGDKQRNTKGIEPQAF